MNILYVNNDMSVSGSPKAIVTEVIELKKRGHKVVVVSRDGELISQLTRAGVKHYIINFPIIGFPEITRSNKLSKAEYIDIFKRFFWKLRVITSVIKLRKIIMSENIEIIQAHQPGPTLVSYLSIINKKVPLVLRIQHILRNEFPSPFYKQIVRHASSISVITKEIKDFLVEIYGINQNKITIIPTGVVFDKVLENKPMPDKTSTPKNTLKILAVSTLGSAKYKSIIELVKAVDKLIKEGEKCRLTIVGDGPYRTEIEQLIRKMGRETFDAIEMVGQQENVSSFYNNCDIVVGVGRVAMEALYFKKLLLCCSHFSYAGIFNKESSEIISNFNFSGRNNTFSSLSYLNIYSDLKYLFTLDNETIEELKEFNKHFFEKHFNIKTIIGKTESLFEECVLLKNRFK